MYFVSKAHVFSLLHAHFDVFHYLMILCHFDQMNDIMMFFLSIGSILLPLNASRLVARDCVWFMHHFGVLIVYDWL